MAVDPRAFIPPAFHRFCINAHGDAVRYIAVAQKRGDIDIAGVVARPVMLDQIAIHPDSGMGGNAIELQFKMLAAFGRIELQVAPIPAYAARPVALRGIGLRIERTFHGPVMGQIELTPARFVEFVTGSASGITRLGIIVGGVRREYGRRYDVAERE